MSTTNTTAATRNKIYRISLSYYRYQVKHTYEKTGLCNVMWKVRDKLKINAPNPYFYMDQYPELFAHKPEDKNSLAYWWDINDTASRIIALKDAILKSSIKNMELELDLNFNTDPIDSTS